MPSRFIRSASIKVSTDGTDGVRHCAVVMELLPVSLEEIVAKRAAASPSPRPFGAATLRSMAAG